MKKKILTLFVLLLVAPFLMQCASQGDVNNLNYQLRVVNKKLDDMKIDTVGQMQKRQAASSSQLDDLYNQILALKGQLEEMAHFNRLLKEQNKELETSFLQFSKNAADLREKELQEFQIKEQQKDTKLSELEEKLAQQQQILASIQQNRIEEAKRKAEAAARTAAEAKARATASSKALANNSQNSKVININADKKKINVSNPPAVEQIVPKKEPVQKKAEITQSSTGVANETDLMAGADKEFSGGNFQQAFALYEKFAENNSGDKSITARFMMGECLFHQKEYDQAILQYQKIISNHPNHPRAASALLKQGVAFENLADFETAKIIYKKISTSYSASPEAVIAEERSSKLN